MELVGGGVIGGTVVGGVIGGTVVDDVFWHKFCLFFWYKQSIFLYTLSERVVEWEGSIIL